MSVLYCCISWKLSIFPQSSPLGIQEEKYNVNCWFIHWWSVVQGVKLLRLQRCNAVASTRLRPRLVANNVCITRFPSVLVKRHKIPISMQQSIPTRYRRQHSRAEQCCCRSAPVQHPTWISCQNNETKNIEVLHAGHIFPDRTKTNSLRIHYLYI